VSPLGRYRARNFFPDLGRRLVLVGGRRNRNNAARVVFRARRALIFPPIEGRTLAPRWMASGAGFLNLSWSSRVAADKAKGAMKDAAGKMIGDKGLQAQGEMDRAKGEARQALGDAKDAAKHVRIEH
jgi:uncharacterized protein YjbJ (UPF0337 family)